MAASSANFDAGREPGAELLLGHGHLLAKLEGAAGLCYAQVPLADGLCGRHRWGNGSTLTRGAASDMKNADWVRDEIILAMDLYVRAGRKQLSPGHDEVVRLSRLLNSHPIHPTSIRNEDFRNPNGISMILGNVLGVDPRHDQPGLSRNNQLQASIWKEFVDKLSLLRGTAEAIESAICIESGEETNELFEDVDIFPEGHILTRLHALRERNRAAVDAKIEQVLGRDERLACEACGFDFLAFYGVLGSGFAECHHIVPLADAASSRVTRLSDLAIVCANCHRMLHRARPVLTVEALRNLIARPSRLQHGGVA